MEVQQTYIVKTKIVFEALNYNLPVSYPAYCVLFECEKNHWYVKWNDHIERISPEAAIHIRCICQQIMS